MDFIVYNYGLKSYYYDAVLKGIKTNNPPLAEVFWLSELIVSPILLQFPPSH